MGFYIPIFFVEINYSDIPTRMDSWEDIREILEKIYNSNGEYGYFSVSRNFWHAYALLDICNGLGTQDLDFVWDDIVCLKSPELISSKVALDDVKTEISNGLVKVYSGGCDLEHSSWICDDYSSKEIKQAYSMSLAKRVINGSYSDGIEQLIDLFSYTKSLYEAISSAIENKKALLYAKPPP